MFTRNMLPNAYDGGIPLAEPMRSNFPRWSRAGFDFGGTVTLNPQRPSQEFDWLDKTTWPDGYCVVPPYQPRGL